MDVSRGNTEFLQIILNGDIPAAMGEVTLGGWMRCGVKSVMVPNPCSDPCAFGVCPLLLLEFFLGFGFSGPKFIIFLFDQ